MRPRQTPTYEANIPESLSGDGEMAARLASAYFGEPMPWQPHLLDVMLARDERDKFIAKTMGISVPRQNGKSWVVRARCFYGALNGESTATPQTRCSRSSPSRSRTRTSRSFTRS